MKYLLLFSYTLPLLLLAQANFAQETPGMTNAIMDKIIKSEATNIEGQPGNWQVLFRELPIFILTDETNNRMRIFTPFAEEKILDDSELKKMLEANFHSALDAKYSIFEGFVISVYMHPLRELTREQFVDAMGQVVNLAQNFGTSYSSTGLLFSPGIDEQPEADKKKENREDRLNKKPGKHKS